MSAIKSASLIIFNSIKSETRTHNFNLLMLKRIASTQSFAGNLVFPGGTLDQSDYQDKWQPIIEKRFPQSENIICDAGVPIYEDSRAFSSSLRPGIFYRICAIRETFEETGILLARDRSGRSTVTDDQLLQDIKLHNWQDKVARNSDHFIEMCTAYDIVPDLAALKEWSEWVTPSVYKRRFNTIFFLSVLHGALTTSVNRSEYEDFFWKSPKNLLENHFETGEIVAPQALELFNLDLLSSWQNVEEEAARRSLQQCKTNMGQIFNLSNGRMFLFAGDSSFRPELECQAREFSFPDKTVVDFQRDPRKRRIVFQESKIRIENSFGLDFCNEMSFRRRDLHVSMETRYPIIDFVID